MKYSLSLAQAPSAVFFLAPALLFMQGCEGGGSKRDATIAEAFAGPVTLNLRAEINPQSKTVATASHGEKIEVVQVRRRFVRVRTPRGGEGWTELRNLLGQEQMDALDQLAKRAAKLPSQGEATVYTSLNIHAEPNRTSTSFYRITEGVKVDVVGHQLVPRVADSPGGFRIPKPAPRVRRTKEKSQSKVPPPPRPAAPALPGNWQELSKTQLPGPTPEELIAQEKKAADKPKVIRDDWSLVRTKQGRAGWVLTRNLVMAIPDEVAYYSEGARISSYFILGDVQDGDQRKHHWLWTTIRNAGEYDFDSFRVFIWNLRKHRYETSYIERRIEGFYPVVVNRDGPAKFALIVRDEAGALVRRTYVLEGYLVRKINDEPWEMKSGTPGATIAGKAPREEAEPTGESANDEEEGKKDLSLMERLRGVFGRR